MQRSTAAGDLKSSFNPIAGVVGDSSASPPSRLAARCCFTRLCSITLSTKCRNVRSELVAGGWLFGTTASHREPQEYTAANKPTADDDNQSSAEEKQRVNAVNTFKKATAHSFKFNVHASETRIGLVFQ